MTEYEPVLIEILVEVMDPSFVCLVSRVLGCSFLGSAAWQGRAVWTLEGFLSNLGLEAESGDSMWESQASRSHHFTEQPCLFGKVLIRALILAASSS